MDENVFLNDGETFTSIDGVMVVDRHGIAYDLAALWHAVPLSIRERARKGDARRWTKIDKVIAEGSLDSPYG